MILEYPVIGVGHFAGLEAAALALKMVDLAQVEAEGQVRIVEMIRKGHRRLCSPEVAEW